MSQKFYTKNGEWVVISGNRATCGLTQWAVDELGEITFVALPAPGLSLTSGEPALTVEAVKAAADCYSPVTGQVSEINEILKEDPALLNRDPEGNAWLFKASFVEMNVDDLMDEAAFKDWIKDPHD